MSFAPRPLWRTSLISGLLVFGVSGLVFLGFATASWQNAVQFTLRSFLAGAIIPLVFVPLAGGDPSDTKYKLGRATAGLAALCVFLFPYLLHVLLLPIITLGALTTDRFHRTGVVLLFVTYATSIVLWLAAHAARLYLPPMWFGYTAGFVGACAFGALILAWALRSPRSWTRWQVAAPSLLLGILLVWNAPAPLERLGTERFLRRKDLNAFAARVQEYGRIGSMQMHDDEDRLNGSVVRETPAQSDRQKLTVTIGGNFGLLENVLARDRIEPAVYEEFRGMLRRFHFRGLEQQGDYVLFARTRDGGLMYAAPHAPLLQRGDTVPGTLTEAGERWGRWYFYY